jgi:hypothetical protein
MRGVYPQPSAFPSPAVTLDHTGPLEYHMAPLPGEVGEGTRGAVGMMNGVPPGRATGQPPRRAQPLPPQGLSLTRVSRAHSEERAGSGKLI